MSLVFLSLLESGYPAEAGEADSSSGAGSREGWTNRGITRLGSYIFFIYLPGYILKHKEIDAHREGWFTVPFLNTHRQQKTKGEHKLGQGYIFKM